MGIATREFEIAMETFGAERLETNYGHSIPSFKIGNIGLVDSGLDFVVQQENRAPIDIVRKAHTELGIRRKDIIQWNEIRSLRGLFTFALMVEDRYSKNAVNNLINKTYLTLLQNSLLKKYITVPYTGINLSSSNKLYDLLNKYDKIINPFSHDTHKKMPSEYLDDLLLDFSFDTKHFATPNMSLSLSSTDSSVQFVSSPDILIYYAEYLNDETKATYNGYTSFEHCFITDLDNSSTDEILTINIYSLYSNSTNLNISLKTGLAWNTDQRELSVPLTDSQLDFIIEHLEKCISTITKTITSKIII